ncbi:MULTISPECIES: hypothetical protein [Microcystis]|uniref:DUF3782 domain-containing protein n=2 Tax=Microcystis TaxID=1125 RepID=A0A0K1RW45_9CHRO|nr:MULTISPECIES: hypothetical protein [Microcystis]AKV66035.1 hypothetical protein VL20_829 [Microcystis panniformis FACHB-1757]MCA2591861.1 DUF3782 domain-containing protein [Microcystis sp. M31BS1]MDB9409202.1 DUF3782 domain-containing protein [Microcystis aeruginosa CS-558/01A06]TRT70059.1 MAG: DUF3782 domain-containing protein [Microcystis sp. M_OC_Ca_00000000_S217Cul]TRT87963.1 MAG: DUF3782 domain-containing protein [Microcystis sp. M_OC_Ca_00000000_C217Col]
MSEPVTLEDIYQLFRASAEEFDRRLRESDLRRAEMERIFAEAKLENERRAAEAKLESDRRAAELERQAAEAKLESDRRAAEAERSMAELKRTVERTSKAVDSLTTRWGRFVEELVEPAVLRLFQEKGIDIKEVYPRARVKRQGIAMEIDILGVDDTDLVVVECKSRLSQDDVDEFIEKLTRFKIAFPHYKNYRAYGAVAGIEINKGVDRYAYKKGLFVIKPSGDTVAIINDADFQPNTW